MVSVYGLGLGRIESIFGPHTHTHPIIRSLSPVFLVWAYGWYRILDRRRATNRSVWDSISVRLSFATQNDDDDRLICKWHCPLLSFHIHSVSRRFCNCFRIQTSILHSFIHYHSLSIEFNGSFYWNCVCVCFATKHWTNRWRTDNESVNIVPSIVIDRLEWTIRNSSSVSIRSSHSMFTFIW